MKNSGVPWLGDVPAEGNVRKIGALYEERSRKVSEQDYPALSVSKLGVVPQLEHVAKSNDVDNRKLVCRGDFAINSRSDRRGACGIAKQDGSVSLINIVLKPKAIMEPAYFDWLFHSSLFADEFYKWGSGIDADVWSTRWTMMKKIAVPFPPLPEQRRIAAFLDAVVAKIDGIRDGIQREIERLGDYRKSLVAEAVTGKRNSDSSDSLANARQKRNVSGASDKSEFEKRPMKPSGIPWLGDVPAEWEVDKIKYWFEATNTRGNDNLQLLAATQKFGMYPQSKLEGVVQVAEKTDLNTFKTVHVDDFVISLRSFQGGLERSDYEGVCSPAYQTFHATRQIDTGYFKYLFKSPGFIQAINLLTVGIREGKTINYSDVRNLSVPIPPLPEQREIAAFLDKATARIDAVVEARKGQLEKLEALKKTIIAEYTTGKKEVLS